MSGNMQRHRVQMSDGECCAVSEEMIELAAVPAEFRTGVEKAAEGLLHGRNALADGELSAHLLLQPRRRRQVVCVGMCFEVPLHLQPLVAHVVHKRLRRAGRGAARCHLEVEHAVDDGAGQRARIPDHVAGGKGHRVEERRHVRCVHATGVGVLHDSAGCCQADIGCSQMAHDGSVEKE